MMLTNLRALSTILLIVGATATGVDQVPAVVSGSGPAGPQVHAIQAGAVLGPADEVLHQALRAVDLIEEPEERARLFTGLGLAQARQGHREAALGTLRKALEAAEAIRPEGQIPVPHPLVLVARAQAELGGHEEARRTFRRAVRFVESATESQQAAQWEELLPIQLEVQGRDAARETIAAYRRYLLSPRSGATRGPAYRATQLVGLQAAEGDFAGALRAVDQMKELQGPRRALDRCRAVLAVVEALRPQDRAVAEPVLAEARRAVDSGSRSIWSEAAGYEVIARAQARLGRFEDAVATTVAMVGKILETAPRGDAVSEHVLAAFAAIASEQLKAGDRAGARDSARWIVRIIEDARGRIIDMPRLMNAARILIEAEALEEAVAAFTAATLRREWSSNDFTSMVVPMVAQAREAAGNHGGAQAMWRLMLASREDQLAEAKRREPRDEPAVARISGQIAVLQARLGDRTGALRSLADLEDRETRQQALASVARELARRGDVATAVKLVAAIDSFVQRDRAWIELAQSLPAPLSKPR